MSERPDRMYKRTDIANESAIPSWGKEAYKKWHEIVSDYHFPCHFGVQAEKADHLRYCFAEEQELSHLPEALIQFLTLSRNHPEKRHALVLFVKPGQTWNSFDDYHDYFWEVLSFLHEQDPLPWPENIPLNPDDPLWEFSFGGEPIFISGNAPIYEKHTTRNVGPCLVLIFQPRRIFQDISYETPQGKRAIDAIRRKVEAIEGMPIHPDLGAYGDGEKREWKQYMITDDNQPAIGKCPMSGRLVKKRPSTP
ncbi:YqcI/YcgG family protein [Pradoshia sp.]|uniref:YqcI/YcgG family protein n=1 Tax=Pradoshia sp. TaxID=2651281 RepID=UPI003F05018C